MVSIDINSGRSTREHNIEQTAYATNIEAAHEIARQLRLRDMAGLVVIDFIDMESNGHIRKVEKAMKDALKNDRARIQVGRISSFGLMEMSRQRLRTGVLEASTRPCPHCEGTGLMRTASSAGLSALRMLEDEAARGRGSRLVLRAGREAAIYLLNRKRAEISDVEQRYGVLIEVLIEESFEGAKMTVESFGPPPAERPRPAPVAALSEPEEDFVEEEDEEEEEQEEFGDEAGARQPRRESREERTEGGEGRGRRRRRGRRGGRRRERIEGEGEGPREGDADDEGRLEAPSAEANAPVTQTEPAVAEEQPIESAGEEPARKSRRRPRARKRDEAVVAEVAAAESAAPAGVESAPESPPAEIAAEAKSGPEDQAEAAPAKPKRTRRKRPAEAEAEVTAGTAPSAAPDAANDQEAAPRRGRRKAATPAPAPALEPAAEGGDDGTNEDGSPRRGWWQRTFGA